MARHGGYRKPTSPAAASGPGALSRRTDGQPSMDLPDAKYGEGAAFTAAQQAAPMSASPAPGVDLSSIIPFGAPSQRPDEPVTAGLPGGPGAGPTLPTRAPVDPEKAAKIRSYLPVLITLASRDDADTNLKQLVRQLRADLG